MAKGKATAVATVTGFAELEKLGELFSNAAFRKSFAADPFGTMALEKLDAKAIPTAVLDTLVSLSVEELAVLARVKITLTAAGVPDRVICNMV